MRFVGLGFGLGLVLGLGSPSRADEKVVVTVDAARWRWGESQYHAAQPGRHTFVVDASVADANAETGGVLSRAAFTPAHKVDLAQFPTTRGVVVRLDCARAHEEHLAALRSVFGDSQTKVVDVGNWRVSLVGGTVTREHAERIAGMGFVIQVQARRTFEAHTLASQAAELGSLGAVTDMAAHWPGTNEIVAIGDTGLDVRHCSFLDSGNRPVGYATLPVDTTHVMGDTGHARVRGYYTVCLDEGCFERTDAVDVADGHGTFVASQAVGSGACAAAGGPGAGSSPGARVLFFDFGIVQNPNAIEIPSNFYAVLATARANGARAFSASWGSPGPGYDDLMHQIDEFVFAHPDFLIVVSGGNAGQTAGDAGRVGSPAGSKNVLSFGASMLGSAAYATNPARRFDAAKVNAHPDAYAISKIASFTSRGPTLDGRTAPLVCGPGVGVVAAEAGGAQGSVRATTKSGTSMANPNWVMGGVRARIAAAMGVAASAVRAATLRAVAIAETTPSTGVVDLARDQTYATTSGVSPESRAGFGVVRFRDGFFADSPSPASGLTVVTDAIATGETSTFCFSVSVDEKLVIALAWDDPPGPALVNALGLIAVSGSNVASDLDVINNHKRVVLGLVGSGSQSQNLRVTVFAPGIVARGPQAYSLVLVTQAQITQGECAEESCDTHEPPVTCAIPNGRGVYACGTEVPGVLSTACFPVGCDAGFSFSGLQCLPSGGDVPVPAECDFVATGEVWDGTRCACAVARVAECENIAMCGDACVPHARLVVSDVPGNTTTASPTFANPPQDAGGVGTSYVLGMSFWGAGLAVFVIAAYALRARGVVTPEGLVAVTTYNLVCGAAVAYDCGINNAPGITPLCLSEAHLAGLWTIWGVATLQLVLYLDALVDGEAPGGSNLTPGFLEPVSTTNSYGGPGFGAAPVFGRAPFPEIQTQTDAWGRAGMVTQRKQPPLPPNNPKPAQPPHPPPPPAETRRNRYTAGSGWSCANGCCCFDSHADPNAGVWWSLVAVAAAFALMDLNPPTAFFIALLAFGVLVAIFYPALDDATTIGIVSVVFVFVFVVFVCALAGTNPSAEPALFAVVIVVLVFMLLLACVFVWSVFYAEGEEGRKRRRAESDSDDE